MSLYRSNSLKKVDLCILNVESRNDYLNELNEYIYKKHKTEFSLKLKFKDKENWHKLLTERPFIKDYFPGYEKYIWLDADTYVLQDEFIDNLDQATISKDIAIAPEINESYFLKIINLELKESFHHFIKYLDGHLKIIRNILIKILQKTYFLDHYLIMVYFV